LGQQKKIQKFKMYLILVFVLFWKKHRKKKKRGELKTESAKHTVLNSALKCFYNELISAAREHLLPSTSAKWQVIKRFADRPGPDALSFIPRLSWFCFDLFISFFLQF